MSGSFAEWPAEIRFTTREVEVLLGALELAVQQSQDDAALPALRRAQVVIWRKLWPELADQYHEPRAGEEA
jgi:hypothetical protein